MELRQFQTINAEAWNAHFVRIEQLARTGGLIIPEDHSISYPTSMVITRAGGHFIVELTGISSKRQRLQVLKGKAPSADVYFNGTDIGSPTFVMADNPEGMLGFMRGISCGSQRAWNRLPEHRRYLSNLWASRIICGDTGSRIFDLSSSNYVNFGGMGILWEVGRSVFPRFIHEAVCVRVDEKPAALADYLRRMLDSTPIRGMFVLPHQGNQGALTTSMLFANMYCTPVRETTIGLFLKQNRHILLGSFGAVQFLSEPRLYWKDGRSGGDKFIQPDLLLKRPDGYWDICDLKLALLNRPRLIRNGRKRRGFVNPVEDGLSQLAHYGEYFETPENAQYAFETYGVRMSAPRKILVIGAAHNYTATEVGEALRKHRATFDVLSWDSLLLLYLAGKGVDLPSSTQKELLLPVR